MECNRDEAMRAKEIAERKFLAKDYKAAKRFGIKAQNLYPGLEGISQMITTMDVYASAEEKISGEDNWYGILGLSPRADDETVRKQYRKLALMLHPDKNKAVGAEGAFKLVSQAWSLLSDKSRRSAYDQRCGATSKWRNYTSNWDQSSTPTQNGFYNFAKSATSQARASKSNSSKGDAPRHPASSRRKERHTFWTVCHRCKMQYEYLRMYLNHNLLCPNCHEAYFAAEINPPSSGDPRSQQQRTPNQQGTGKNTHNSGRNNSSTSNVGPSRLNNLNNKNRSNFQWVPFSETAGAASSVQAANMVQQAYEKVKQERQKAQAATRREEIMQKKKHSSKRTIVDESTRYSGTTKRRKGIEHFAASKNMMTQKNAEIRTSSYQNSSLLNKSTSGEHTMCDASKSRTADDSDIKSFLVGKACKEILKKLQDWRLNSRAKFASTKEVDIIKIKDGKDDAVVYDAGRDSENEITSGDSNLGASDASPYKKQMEQMLICVPSPEFYDFGRDRLATCFGGNQVWAVYDDNDGMPRRYAMIHNVISLNPFAVRISWLKLKMSTRQATLNFGGSGFVMTCGDFNVGRHAIYNSLNSFSHKVRWRKGIPGEIQIYPQKGDVWALYRNWSFEWHELTEYEVIHKYDIVEVLEDYNEEQGVIVIPLVKVADSMSVFHQHLDPKEIRIISSEEIFCFSHQVPSHLIKGTGELNAPTGCWELDPAASPAELLEVITDIKETDRTDNEENIEIIKIVDDS